MGRGNSSLLVNMLRRASRLPWANGSAWLLANLSLRVRRVSAAALLFSAILLHRAAPPAAGATAFVPSAVPATPTAPSSAAPVHRIEVRPRPGIGDPKGDALVRTAARLNTPLTAAATTRVYLIQADLSTAQLDRVAASLLADPVTEAARRGTAPLTPDVQIIEVHPLPGVMDPAAQSVAEAVRVLLQLPPDVDLRVTTGLRYDLTGLPPATREAAARRLAEQALANPVVQAIHTAPYQPTTLPEGHEQPFRLRTIPIRELTADQLTRMSREAHLFLSLDEMLAVQDEFRRINRDPTDIELETIAQTWSEHCVHKTLKSTIHYRGTGNTPNPIRWQGRPGHVVHPDGSVTIRNLLKSTVAAATHELIADGLDWTLSVFKDNSGVIAFDDTWGVCIKVETHNHPSALEPYGGSATGIGGCIRDVIGTGRGAKPIASTDVFCVAFPDHFTDATLPPGCLPPRRILTDVVAGIRDYGNRMGIPTVAGAVYFDDRHVGNPLVFAGCVGLIPRHLITGAARPGDRIIALGGRTGRDGIHGATFSSAELEHTAADEFAHAVQIGNAIEEKRTLDAILRARDVRGGPLYHAITDCGAGGFSSAVGEMGGALGAEVNLERAPLKYAGLSYTEIWISEAQERMVLAVPPANVAALAQICAEEGVELADLGHFGTPEAELVLKFKGTEVGRLAMGFLHEGIPTPVREAEWTPGVALGAAGARPAAARGVQEMLLRLLAHPNIASKHWIIRQYDHEVQGATVVKPLSGSAGRGPMDASVLAPVEGTTRGIALACGLQTGLGAADATARGGDPYLMVLAAVDECVRNLVCVGADPERIAILDNFCWPSCAEPRNLATLVRASEGCYDAAKAYRTPFVSGKDSLNNQLRYTDPATGAARVIEIPPTLLITGLAIVPDVTRCVTMDAKRAGSALVLAGATQAALGGAHAARVAMMGTAAETLPVTDLEMGPRTARAVAGLIAAGGVRAAHDVSDGGLLCAVAEMLIATTGHPRQAALGARVDLSAVREAQGRPLAAEVAAFSESPMRYVLEVADGDAAVKQLAWAGVPAAVIGVVDDSGRLRASGVDVAADDLARAWLTPLDW